MSAALIMPGIDNILLPNDLEFLYTRNVPCTTGSVAPSCVEIVVHATPQQEPLRTVLEQMTHALHLPPGRAVQYWSTESMYESSPTRTL